MPREKVQGMSRISLGEIHEEGEDPWEVRVGWSSHGGDVQIATVDPNSGQIGERESGLWVDLDRQGVNDLIRKLRRARDGAFGRDE